MTDTENEPNTEVQQEEIETVCRITPEQKAEAAAKAAEILRLARETHP